MKEIKDENEKIRKERERANKILAKNFYEINIKRKILSIFSKNFEDKIKRQIDISLKIKRTRDSYLKKLFFNYLKLYLDFENDKMYLIKNNIEEIIKVCLFSDKYFFKNFL